jgi:uncharacterized membrane protein HdeD (DUF308 family)
MNKLLIGVVLFIIGLIMYLFDIDYRGVVPVLITGFICFIFGAFEMYFFIKNERKIHRDLMENIN